MFTAECPSCGARVALRAATSTAAVCAFCRSTLVRRADVLERIGVQGELLEDHARVQIGTGGRFDGRGFTVVGRIQLRDDDGGWNEWHVLFDDGTTGWLSEAGGQYAVTVERGPAAGVASFDALAPATRVTIRGEPWTVTDRRTARCTAAEGELPFPADSRWEAKVVDLRAGDRLVTLDWSDGDPPKLYVGRAVALDALSPTLLRAVADVQESAGALEGGLVALECPSCGAPVRYVPALAANVTCRRCKSELSGGARELVVDVERADRSQRPTWLELGDAADHAGERWTVIGILVRRADEDPQEWTEYLLYSPKAGFRWLVHAQDTLQWVEVLNELPVSSGSGARARGEVFTRSERYDSITTWVAGSFNWRPKVGDRATVTEFALGDGAARRVLALEETDTEATWSLGEPVAADAIAQAFGKPATGAGSAAGGPQVDGGTAGAGSGSSDALRAFTTGSGLKPVFVAFVVLLGLVSLPSMLFGDTDDLILPGIVALVALWGPLKLLGEWD